MTTVPFPMTPPKPADAPGGADKSRVAGPLTPKTVWTPADFAIIATVLGLGFMAALTAIGQVRHRQARAELADRLVGFSTAFQTYAREHEMAPPDAPAGRLPAGMDPYLSAEQWTSPTSAGGSFQWQKTTGQPADKSSRTVGRILITAFAPSPAFQFSHADLAAIDQRIDDGDLATGRFRTGFMGWPMFVVPAPP